MTTRPAWAETDDDDDAGDGATPAELAAKGRLAAFVARTTPGQRAERAEFCRRWLREVRGAAQIEIEGLK